MNLRFLETFVWLAHLGSFRMTAERLCTTQAAVSQRIAALEQDLGQRLFERGAAGVSLTTAGRDALEHAVRVLDAMDEMRRAAGDRACHGGRLRLGAIEPVVHAWLPAFLARLQAMHPTLEITLATDASARLLEQLAAGRLDLALHAASASPWAGNATPLGAFPLRWIAAERLRLHHAVLEPADLAAEDVAAFSETDALRPCVGRLFDGAPAAPRRVHAMDSIAALGRWAADGHGVALLPAASLLPQLEAGAVRLLRVRAPAPGSLAIAASARGGPNREWLGPLLRLARQCAVEFAGRHSDEIAIGPSGCGSPGALQDVPDREPAPDCEPA